MTFAKNEPERKRACGYAAPPERWSCTRCESSVPCNTAMGLKCEKHKIYVHRQGICPSFRPGVR
jgi:hypothetical protein